MASYDDGQTHDQTYADQQQEYNDTQYATDGHDQQQFEQQQYQDPPGQASESHTHGGGHIGRRICILICRYLLFPSPSPQLRSSFTRRFVVCFVRPLPN
jgi:hypothetical protein